MREYQNTIQSLNAMVDDGIVPGISWAIFEGKTTLKNVDRSGSAAAKQRTTDRWHAL